MTKDNKRYLTDQRLVNIGTDIANNTNSYFLGYLRSGNKIIFTYVISKDCINYTHQFDIYMEEPITMKKRVEAKKLLKDTIAILP